MGNIEEVSGEQHDWRNLALSFCRQYDWGVHLKCLYTNAQSMGNKQEELQVCTLAELLRVTKTWWDSSHNGVLPRVDGWIQAGKEGQCMQRRSGSAQCFALE